MEGKLMKSKAFIFSVTALYFVMLFVLFMGLISYTYHNAVYKQTTPLTDKTASAYIQGNNSTSPPPNGWCIRRIVYDANTQSSSQSQREIKIYCEDYGTQRFI
jgi:cell division protein FtsI/penicillin-binding protein 2